MRMRKRELDARLIWREQLQASSLGTTRLPFENDHQHRNTTQYIQNSNSPSSPTISMITHRKNIRQIVHYTVPLSPAFIHTYIHNIHSLPPPVPNQTMQCKYTTYTYTCASASIKHRESANAPCRATRHRNVVYVHTDFDICRAHSVRVILWSEARWAISLRAWG